MDSEYLIRLGLHLLVWTVMLYGAGKVIGIGMGVW